MDFLLDNPITAIEGTAFVVLFINYCLLIIAILGIAKSNLDNTDKLPMPAIPPEVDPFEVAYLRGGANEMARAVIFSLVQKGRIEIVNDDKKGGVRRRNDLTETGTITEIEKIALHWIGSGREAKEVFDTKIGLVEQLERHCTLYQIGLSNRQFLMPDDLKRRARKYGVAAAAMILGLGGYKVLASVYLGSFNIIFTIVITVIALVIAMTIGMMPRVTKLGKLYLARLQSAFEDLKYRSQAPYIGTNAQRPALAEGGYVGVDPLLLSVGIFGTGILAGTMFSSYNDAFARQQAANSSGGCGASGCGSSCGSSCGSGCGGGGCGGGCG